MAGGGGGVVPLLERARPVRLSPRWLMALGVVALIGVEAAQPAVARRVDGGVGGGIAEAPHEKLVLQAATPMLSVQDASATEGSPVQFTVTLDRGGSTEQVTVDYSTSGGTATEGTDYTAATGTLTFSSGQTTHTVSVETTTDDAVEADEETFTLTLSNPTGAEIVDGAATGAIVDANNQPPMYAQFNVIIEVDENVPAGTLIGEPVTATDREGGLVYTLGGDDAALFGIDARTGQLSTAAVFDYETDDLRIMTVTATDPEGESATIDVFVLVENVNELGTVTVTPSDAGAGQEVTVALTDPDGGVSGVAWQWRRSPDKLVWTDIADATETSYTLTAEDYQQYVRAVATYTDPQGSDQIARATLPKDRPNQPPVLRPRLLLVLTPAFR